MILNQAPGAITVTGSVTDYINGVQVAINGTPAAVDASGEFSADIASAWGINLLTLEAVDGIGREARTTCAFLLSETWAPDDAVLSSTVSLRTRQAAFDDGNRADGLDSFADILHTVINSSGLRNNLHASLLASNPLKPSQCDSSVLGVCVLRSQVRYVGLQIDGPHTTSLALVNGGLRSLTTARNIHLRIRVDGHVAGIPYDTTGWITYESGTVDVTFDTRLAGGEPRVSVRPGSVSTSVGTISTDFSGLDGAIIDIVTSLFNGTVRSLVADVLRDFVTDNFDDILDDTLRALDINNLAATFSVPRLDDAASLAIDFLAIHSSLNTTTSRMLSTMGTQFRAAPAHARPTLGAPIPSGTRILDAPGSSPIADAVHVGALNQALHALWRGGYFDGSFGGSALGGLVRPGVTLETVAGLPPAARLPGDGRLEVALGAVSARLTDPALSPDPVDLRLGGKASCEMRLAGDDLVAELCRVDVLALSVDGAVLDAQEQLNLERFLTDVLNHVAATAVNDALPALPVPGFTLPASLAEYGLPAAGELGVVNPVLSTNGDHMVLQGAFGLR